MSNEHQVMKLKRANYRTLRRAVVATLAGALIAPSLRGQVLPTLSPTVVPSSDPSTQPFTQLAATQSASTQSAATQAIAKAPSPPVRMNRPPTTQISFNFRDAPIDTVLDHLSQDAGFVILRTAPINARVSAQSSQSVSPSEAVALLNSALKDQGYTAVQMGRILKIEARDRAKKESIPVHFGADPDQIDETDELITQVIPVRSVDAVKLKADLTPLVGTDADLASNAGSNTIIITDSSSNIRRIVTIIQSMDKRDATQAAIHVKQLKYADATAAAKLVNDIFNPTTTAAQTPFNPAQFFGRGRGGGGFGGGGFGGGGFGGGGFGGGGGQPQTSDDDKGNTGKVTASSDARTNTVVVTGPEDTLAVIDGVLSQLDANPVEDQAFFIYHVKNGQAVDMAATLNSLFLSSTSTPSSSANNNRTSTNSQTGNRNSGFGGSSGSSFGGSSSNSGQSSSINRSFNNGSTGGGGNTGGNRPGGGTTGGGTGANGAQATGIAALQNQVNVVPDADTNTLLVATATKYQDQVKLIIQELDRPVQQVLIKVLIAEVTHDNSSDLGLDFSVLNLRPSGNGQNLVSNLGNAAAQTANGGLAISVLENNLTATFHALAVQGRLDVLSRPYILTSDNQEANILVGQEYPFVTDTRTTDAGETINTVQYQSIGIGLDVTPHINPDGLVILDVAPQVQDVAEGGVTITNGVTSPIFDTRTASSRVGVRDGDTIVIGGLMQDQKQQTINKIPILGDIPYVGVLFSRNNTTKTKSELLIFLTPHVAPIPDSLRSMARSETSNLKLTPSAVEPGTFQDQLHGMAVGARDATTAPALTAPPAEKSSGDAVPEPNLPGDKDRQPLTGQQQIK